MMTKTNYKLIVKFIIDFVAMHDTYETVEA